MDVREERAALRRTSPSADGLARLSAQLFPGGRIVRVRKLGGGLATATSALTVDRQGHVERFVLKRYRASATRPRREFERLEFVKRARLPGPEPIAFAEPGEWFDDNPALLMRLVPGHPLRPLENLATWTTELADALALIHATDLHDAPALVQEQQLGPWEGPDATPEDRRTSAALTVLNSAAARAARTQGLVFTHGDFHPGNTLWRKSRLVGVVDWTDAATRPCLWELAYCRTDVALLAGVAAAESVRRAYLERAGVDDRSLAVFDLECALYARAVCHHWLGAYHEHGHTHLTLRHFRARLNAFIDRTLADL